MPESSACNSYVQDLVYLLREAGADAARRVAEAGAGSRSFEEGRALAYVEVRGLTQVQADAFGLHRDDLGLAGFDPLNGPLASPAVRSTARE